MKAGIVILDDSMIQNAVLVSVLRAAGHPAEACTSLPAALRLCREQLPRLVLVELVLRQGNGYSQASFLQRRTGVPAALMVSRQQPAEVRWARARGLCGVLPRPRPDEAVQQSVAAILHRLAVHGS